MEVGEKVLNFLDLTIRLLPDDLDDGLLTPVFSVYQKPTYTGLSINQQSLHPTSHKFAAIHAAVHRMISLPLSSSEREKEIAVISSIAEKNGLSINVPTLVKRTILRRSLNQSRSDPAFAEFSSSHFGGSIAIPASETTREKWLRLPYLGSSSDRLASELRRFGYRVGFYPLTRVRDLSKLKDPVPVIDSPGVYLLTCSCGDLYVGQTGRALSKRFSEHRTHFNKLQKKPSASNTSLSAMARHCFHQSHPFDSVHASLLHRCENGSRLNRLEEYYYTIKNVIESRESNLNMLNDLDVVFFNSFIRFNLNYK